MEVQAGGLKGCINICAYNTRSNNTLIYAYPNSAQQRLKVV